MAMKFNENEIRKAIAVLKPDGELFEIRLINGKWNMSGYFKDADTLIEELKNARVKGTPKEFKGRKGRLTQMHLTFDMFLEENPDTELTVFEFARLESKAEDDINALTFNRISARGFDSLSDFQKSIIRRAVAMQVIFVHENSELINSPLSSYSVSGISMSFDTSKLLEIGSVTTSREVYALLMQTGLCYGGIT